MALTRITSGVISANAVSAEKLANGSISSRTLGNNSIELRHLSSSANFTGSIDTVQANLTANSIQFTANLNTTSSNIASISANVNIVSTNVAGVAANTIQNKANVDTALANVIQLNANIDVVQNNVAAIIDGSTAFTGEVTMSDDLIVSGNLIVNGDTTTANSINMIVQDRMIMLANSATGTPAADVGFLFNRGNQGNAAFFYDETATTFKIADTQDPSSNTSLSPVTLSNLAVGKLSFDGADLSTAIADNRSGAVSTVFATDLTASRALSSDASGKIAVATTTLVELNYLSGVSGGIQAQLDLLDSQANAHDTFTKLNANINTVSGNVDAGVGLLKEVNVATSTGSSNVFFAKVPSGTQHPTNIANVNVFIDGIRQEPDDPGTSNNDFVYDTSDASVTITDPSLPSGLKVLIDVLAPRPS